MDRETKRAYQLVQLRIIEHLDRLEANQKARIKLSGDVHTLKKWRRFGAAFAWDPSVFQSVLENPFMSDADLIRSLRSGEETLMRRWGYIDNIPLHHIIADRTGGDLGIRTPIDIWLDTKKRIFDLTGARPGNNKGNLNAAGAFDELWHQGRVGAKGSVFAKAGLIRPENFPYLHRAGQNLAEKLGKDPKIVLATAEEQAKLLLSSIGQQQERYQQVLDSAQHKNQLKAFSLFPEFDDLPAASIEEIQGIKQITKHTPIPDFYARAGSIIYNPVEALRDWLSTQEGTDWYNKVNAGRIAEGLNPLKDINLIQKEFGSGFGTEAYRQLKGLVTDTIKNPVGLGAGLALDVITSPEIGWQLGKGDLTGAGKTLATETVKGAVIGAGLQAVVPKLMSHPATALIAAPFAIKGAIDSKVAYDAAEQGYESPEAYMAENYQRDAETYKEASPKYDLPPGSVPAGHGIAIKNGAATVVPWGSVAGEKKVGPRIVGKPWWTLWQ